ncbi:putative nitrate transporter [Cellvibrio sp. BR]|jgi:nitrate/nitrite transport system permease protein|uniref:ABC transporter permease n=1 Tax=unclassified Cellvibrio TaxID=2624793 RepID=UPI00026009A5|nr:MULTISPECIES: ABC transporter permease [unclassified Cellvibrio]EIK43121.1 putative nitrate transporter [Cellvibrio sp. BR]QEY12243.1 ABC transporter permease [Cellvibrio sp. KY-YJ-3]UUA72467.1 ABC transporter permease [Cellvibrio sp. QJXJ]
MSNKLATLKLEQFKAIKWREVLIGILMPLVGVLFFMMLWHGVAPNIKTSLGDFPQPKQVYEQWGNLVDEYQAEQERAAVFYERQEKRNAELLAKDPNATLDVREFNGRPTFFDKIYTSLFTVLSGFLVASLIAIPVGILIGLSQPLYSAINPLIQLFKPVSPLAWLPLVTIVVSAVYVSDSPMFSKSYIISLLTVSLCSLWPTMINTAVGVAGVSKDLVNVSRVLRLGWFTHVAKIVLPSAIPMMFTGLRISLGIAWMVLIAAEMLSQNPGLGKFVWDEFQNGSSDSLSRICLAILVIGIIGFLLDRTILMIQTYVNWDKSAVVR